MEKIKLFFFVIIVTSIISLILTQKTFARESDSSAVLLANIPQIRVDSRSRILHDFLVKRNSPLSDYAGVFIQQADKYNLDWKLVVAISGVESGFGQAIPVDSYNGWGFGVYGAHVLRFASWSDGIATVSKSLKKDYIDKYKAENIYAIGSIYAADPNWANKVNYYINEISGFETQNSNSLLSISL